MTEITSYSSADISTAEGLEGIRNRPTQYLSSMGLDGITHMIKELLDNSNDELMQFDHGILTAVLFRDPVRNTFQILVHDTGRGIPATACKDCIIRPGTSGKFIASKAYQCTGGLFGVGGKVAPALSTRYKVLSRSGEGTFQMTLRESEIVSEYIDDTALPFDQCNTTIVMEIDPKFFEDTVQYQEAGYLDIIKLFRMWNIFNNIRYIFKISDQPLAEPYWSADVDTTLGYINGYVNDIPSEYSPRIEYDSDQDDPRLATLNLFNVTSPIIWETQFEKARTNDDRLAFRIRILMTKKLGSGCLHLLNNIVVSNSNSDHITGFYRALNKKLLQYIEREDLKNFFTSSGYTIPIYTVLNIKYDQAEFAGTTKEAFRNKHFSRQYTEALKKSFENLSPTKWMEFVSNFIGDLEEKFNLFHGKKEKVKDQGLMTMKLNYPNNYLECERLGKGSELFVPEGASASTIGAKRDSTFQAIFYLQGKPKNAILTSDKKRKTINELMRDHLWQDVVTVLGIVPGSNDLSGLNFEKLILTTDADQDGSHIRSIFIANLYTLCPAFVEQGHLYIATPPLYVVSYGKNKKPFYLRNQVALYDMRINIAYRTAFDIAIRSEGLEDIPLNGDAYRDFCHLVLDIGERIENSARVLNLPILILERLVYGIEFITPYVKIDALKNHFSEGIGEDDVFLEYLEDQDVIMLSLNTDDYPIILNELSNEIRHNILPYIKNLRIHDWLPVVTSRLNPTSGFNKQPCTIMQVYQIFNDLNKLFDIDRKKGLGQLSPEDAFATITNEHSRSLIHVTQVGDEEIIYQLLGPDSVFRKNILSDEGAISGINVVTE